MASLIRLSYLGVLILMSFFCLASGNIVLIGKNVTLSFSAIEANFAPVVRGSGECGVLYLAQPIDACSDLKNKVVRLSNHSCSPFVLMVRGGCSFEEKVRRAQKASFQSAIVYDNVVDGPLVAMAGNSAGVKIHALFVSSESGRVLTSYAGSKAVEVWIIPGFENSAWSIMAISFISLLAMSAVLATCFFVRRHRIRREHPRSNPRVREFHGMSSRLVKAMPSLIFTSVLEDNCTSRTCAICLEDYNVGEKIRILPCRHKFHAICVDLWLTSWRTFCPVCKRDARTSTGEPPASESTPLLSRSPSSSSVASSYARSPAASSPAIQISQSPTPSRVHTPSISSTYFIDHQSFQSYRQSHMGSHHSPSMSISGSTNDLRNMSSQRSRWSHLVSPSPHSSGYPSISPLNPRYMSPYAPSPSNSSLNYVGSSHHSHHPLHYSASTASFSPLASAHSLPEC
ncbi:hypothetical protein SAY87_000242 [Trapa incisa]|uniref:RING-type domain-containing protein n=1 Tax=Trapa incisa TaxID=236973 RepID=A0AAN7GBR8_9MYRT|nr:hypothetical protein SAY87_000242 [Trapa incisa]